MKITNIDSQIIERRVVEFMNGRTECWAKPGTENHTNNFYGDHHVCHFTPDELTAIIICAVENWDTQQTIQEIAAEIIRDMQFDRPE